MIQMSNFGYQDEVNSDHRSTRFVGKPVYFFTYFDYFLRGNTNFGVERHQRGGGGGLNPPTPRQIEHWITEREYVRSTCQVLW